MGKKEEFVLQTKTRIVGHHRVHTYSRSHIPVIDGVVRVEHEHTARAILAKGNYDFVSGPVKIAIKTVPLRSEAPTKVEPKAKPKPEAKPKKKGRK